jgi:hypothetical protein
MEWSSLFSFLQSETFWIGLGTAAIGSFAGAWVGAWAAQRIADKARVRQQIVDEMNAVNWALEITGPLCGTYLNLKEQHVRKLAVDYAAQYQQVHEAVAAKKAGELKEAPIIGAMDLSTIDPVEVQIGILLKLVTEKLSVTGRPRPLAVELARCVDSLNRSIMQRNAILTDFGRSGLNSSQLVPHVYAVEKPDGNVDARYRDSVQAIALQTDDCIHFSRILGEDLERYGSRLHYRWKRLRMRGRLPRTTQLGWEKAEAKGLFPNPKRYVSWDETFVVRVDETYGRCREKAGLAVRRYWRKEWRGNELYRRLRNVV